ncbi:MAG: bifunctional serine/threonine-protein kinase/universal stress protein [Rhizobiaceae bacterium]
MERPGPGRVIDGFTLQTKFAKGGMGTLWHASKPGIDYPLVLKLPFLDPGQDVSTIVGFEIEEMILKRLTGPHVPRFAGSGDLAHTPYIAMELVGGENLESLLAKAPLPVAQLQRIGIAVATAVGALHRQKVIHLDLKPENIFLTSAGAVLIDFGLARHLDLPDLLAQESSVPMGTPAYISPEQIVGHRDSPASDIFALGCILYELATGEKPFGTPGTEAGMRRRLFHAPPLPRSINKDLPRWFQEVIQKCMEVDPARRYSDMAKLLFDLNNPDQIAIKERKEKKSGGFLERVSRYFSKERAEAFALPSLQQKRKADSDTIIMVAVDLSNGVDMLAQTVRSEAARILWTAPQAKLACFTVLKTKIIGDDHDVAESGKSAYVSRLVQLKDWARLYELPEDLISYHVIEALDPAQAILDFAARNDVDHIVIGARGSSALRRHLGSVSAKVVAESLCSCTVIRVKTDEHEAVHREQQEAAGE